MKRMQTEPRRILPLGEAAVEYAVSGWPVFSLIGKVPFKHSNGFKDATTDPETIRVWWSRHPKANIGLATGAMSGMIVLDIDPHHGGHKSIKELERRYGQLPPTRTSRTVHGGLHRFYQHPRDGTIYPNAVQLDGWLGIDVRGDGGYVLLPPSRLYNRLSYLWGTADMPIAQAPAWLLTVLLREQQKQEEDPQGAIQFT